MSLGPFGDLKPCVFLFLCIPDVNIVEIQLCAIEFKPFFSEGAGGEGRRLIAETESVALIVSSKSTI